MNLRNFATIKVLKNINNPIMFLGYPLKLAYMYLGSIILGFMSALALSNMKVNWIINIVVPFVIIAVGVFAVAAFYKRYGINDFYLEKEDKAMSNFIRGDMSFQKYIAHRKENNLKK